MKSGIIPPFPIIPVIDIPQGTLRAIIKAAGLTEEEFVAL
jgi:predicted RNA binding protein YcfA (HicA-like mRNA interferase family)